MNVIISFIILFLISFVLTFSVRKYALRKILLIYLTLEVHM